MVIVQGTKGLSLFYLETKDEDGKYNNLQIQVCVVCISFTNCIILSSLVGEEKYIFLRTVPKEQAWYTAVTNC